MMSPSRPVPSPGPSPGPSPDGDPGPERPPSRIVGSVRGPTEVRRVMRRHRPVVLVLGLVDALLLVAGSGLAVTRSADGGGPEDAAASFSAPPGAGSPGGAASSGPAAPGAVGTPEEIRVPGGTDGIPGRRSAGKGEVADRPWPERVAAPGPWPATMAGRGDRLELTVPGSIVGGIGRATVRLGGSDPRPAPGRKLPDTTRFLMVPGDGSRWYPLGPVRLEGPGDLAFSSASARGAQVGAVTPSFESVLRAAQGAVTGLGTFVQADGRQVDRLALPPGTRLAEETCPDRGMAGARPCTVGEAVFQAVEVDATRGMVIRAAGDGEVAVAGRARANALGRSWDGLVAALEAKDLRVAATLAGDLWAVTAEAGSGRQVWVDVWPVIDTKLTARSVARPPGIFDSYGLRIQWTNVGFASSQILEADGVGPGSSAVGFDLNKTVGHDAGLGVTRGDRVVNLRGGGDIDSNLPPGQSVDRGLSASSAPATIVLRGNFPEVRVPLAIRPA